jgi:hypothetical protein
MRPAIVLSLLLLACGTGSSGSEGASSDAPATTTTTTTPTTGTSVDPPSGRSCPLLGLYVECEGGGRTYCDEFAGALRFGPCLDALDCDLSADGSCDGRCELIAGVPTWIADSDGCGESNGATDSL